jgi:hypothetical protein
MKQSTVGAQQAAPQLCNISTAHYHFPGYLGVGALAPTFTPFVQSVLAAEEKSYSSLPPLRAASAPSVLKIFSLYT